MDTLFQDLRYSLRTLGRDRGFALAAGLTLAICIGANAAIFGIIDSTILRPLPFPEPERLVTMWNAYPGAGVTGRGNNAVPDYIDRRELTEVFEELAAFQYSGVALEVEGVAQRVSGMRVTPSFFEVLRAAPAAGRFFTEQEGELGSERVTVLSNDLSVELFGSPAAAVGESLLLGGRDHEIVGVMPTGWAYLDDDVRLWTALAFQPERLQAYHSNNLSIVARLAAGATVEQARARIDALNARNMDRMPELKPLLESAGFHTPVFLLQEDLARDVRGTLYLLWGGAAFVLLIGCLNVANLVLVRSTARARELATRFALGAGRGRVVRQLLTETTVLTLLAALAGLGLGALALDSARGILAESLPRASQIGLSAGTFGFTLLLALVVGALVTLAPLASLVRQDLSAVFREEGRSGTAGRGVQLIRKGMVVAQVAVALLLLVGAALLLTSFQQLLGVDPGFEPEGALTARVAPPSARYPDLASEQQFVARVVAELERAPGVERAAAVNLIPLGGSSSDSVIFAEGYVPEEGESPISPLQYVISPDYFDAMGIELLQGRAFESSDNQDAERVIVIDQRLARRFWPDGDALGQRMWQPTSMEQITDPTDARFYRIVGIAESVTHSGLAGGADTVGAYYFPIDQMGFRWGAYHLVARTSGDPTSLIGSLRGAVAEVDPQLPVYDIRTMEQRVRESLSDRRSPMLLSLTFGGVALFLAAVGIYGVLAHLVSLRTREIGIRIALGSQARTILRLVMREGAVMVGVGLVLGLLGAWGVGRALQSQLYGVGALDPWVLGTVTLLLSAVSIAACLLPARRATRIDPVAALTD